MDLLGSAIGRSIPRIDGRPKVTGRAQFAADIPTAGLLHGRPVLAIPAHARIERIDVAGGARGPGRRRRPDRRGPADRHRGHGPDPRAAGPQRDPVGGPAGRAGRRRDAGGRGGRGDARGGRDDAARARRGPRARVRARRPAGAARSGRGGGGGQRGIAACRGGWWRGGIHPGRAGLGQRRGADRVPPRRRGGGPGGIGCRRRGHVHDQLGPPGLPRAAGRHGRAGPRRDPPRHERDAGHVLHPLRARAPLRALDRGRPGHRRDARRRVRRQGDGRRSAGRGRDARPPAAGPRRADPARGLPDDATRRRPRSSRSAWAPRATAGCAGCGRGCGSRPAASRRTASKGSPRS